MRKHNKATRIRWTALKSGIRDILLNEWDPIGICNVPAAVDEYDEYITSIIKLLKKGASVDSLANCLIHIETKRIGLQGDNLRANHAATVLIEFFSANTKQVVK